MNEFQLFFAGLLIGDIAGAAVMFIALRPILRGWAGEKRKERKKVPGQERSETNPTRRPDGPDANLLPRWRKAIHYNDSDGLVLIDESDGSIKYDTEAQEGQWYIPLSELANLPKDYID